KQIYRKILLKILRKMVLVICLQIFSKVLMKNWMIYQTLLFQLPKVMRLTVMTIMMIMTIVIMITKKKIKHMEHLYHENGKDVLFYHILFYKVGDCYFKMEIHAHTSVFFNRSVGS